MTMLIPDTPPLMKLTIFYVGGSNARAYLVPPEEAASAEEQFLKGGNFAFQALDIDDPKTVLREIVNIANVENMQVSLFDAERDKPRPAPKAMTTPMHLGALLPGATPAGKGRKA